MEAAGGAGAGWETAGLTVVGFMTAGFLGECFKIGGGARIGVDTNGRD